MKLTEIDPFRAQLQPFHLLEKRWLLLCAGDFANGDYNAMTVSWGSFGMLWQRPFVQVFVRPTRYTSEFLERYTDFTLCAFPESQRSALQILGSLSGRDGNKMETAGLTAQAALKVSAPVFAEADLIMECQKMYHDRIRPENFQFHDTHDHYPHQDFHQIIYGEILCYAEYKDQ